MKQEIMDAGCSSFAWETKDHSHLWGRNFDYNTIAQGSGILYVPKGKKFYLQGCSFTHTEKGKATTEHALVGMGSLSMSSTPLIYDGINDAGLSGGELNYRTFAKYEETAKEGTRGVQPMFLLFTALAHCATVDEVMHYLKEKVTIINEKIFGTLAELHWIFSDTKGDTLIVESDATGLNFYKNHSGVLTNSPDYAWHEKNLLNYVTLTPQDTDEIPFTGNPYTTCFSGTGMRGVPGDWSSISRFVRLSLLKQHALPGENEEQGVQRMFRCFEEVAFPLGLVRLCGNENNVDEKYIDTSADDNTLDYDYSVYTCITCAESKRYYWTTYDNQMIQYVDLNQLLDHDDYLFFELDQKQPMLEIKPSAAHKITNHQ